MSEITKPIMLDETGKEIIEALKGISRHAATADMASDSEKLGGKEPSEYLGTGDVPEWAKQPNKPTYTASEVGALPSDGKAVDSDKLNGHPASDYATAESVTALADDVDRHAFGEQSGGRNLTEIYTVSAIGDAKLSSAPLEVGVYTVSGYTPQTDLVADIYGEHVTGGSGVRFAGNRWSRTINVSQKCDVGIYCSSNYDISELQIEKGSSASSYEPYIKSNAMLTEESIRTAELQALGWCVPSEMPIKNSFAGGVLTQRVGRVDLGSLSWLYNHGGTYAFFSTEQIPNLNHANDLKILFCSRYLVENSVGDLYYGRADKIMVGTSSAISSRVRLYIRDTSYDNDNDFKNSLKGVYIYYELDTPITHNITDMPSIQEQANNYMIANYRTPVVSANVATNFYANLPDGVDSTWDCTVSFAAPVLSAGYNGRIFGFITQDGKLRVNILSNYEQRYYLNAIFVKKTLSANIDMTT